MADSNLSKVESYQYPLAHLGHLTTGQQEALERFKSIAEKEGFYKPAKAEEGKANPSHDDETMLRYLRARRFNPQEAYGQFKGTEMWRDENKLEALYDAIDVDDYEETRRVYPQWTGRRDKRGIPVYVFEVGHLNAKRVAAYEKTALKLPAGAASDSRVPSKMLRLFALYENLIRFTMPLCSAIANRTHPETPISQSNNIVDISGVGLKQFWNLKDHMQNASTLATAHYPETLDRIFIIGAPSFFPTVWGWIKRWFDPVTVSKIFILSSSDMKSTLEKYIDIENIPKKYGGKMDFTYGQMPSFDSEILEAMDWEGPRDEKGVPVLPKGPIKWVESATKGTVTAVAVGSVDGKPRHDIIANLPSGVSIKAMHGDLVNANTPMVEKDLFLVETGVSTHPKEYPPDDGSLVPPSGVSSSSASEHGSNTPPKNANATSPPPHEAAAAGTGAVAATTTINTKPSTSTESKPAENATMDNSTRTGTSNTRFEQQGHTHGAGKLAEGTPAVNDHGAGDKTVTMEPITVGQAPKDVSKPLGQEPEFKDTSVIGQAKDLAGKAYEGATGTATAVLSAVGLGGSQAEEKVEGEPKKPADSRIDNADNPKVEEFLRSKVGSTAADAKGAE